MNKKELLLMAVGVFVTILAWILLEVRAIRNETPTEEEIQSVQIEYTVDTSILELLKKKNP